MNEYDKSIIEFYTQNKDGWYTFDFLNLINGQITWYRKTGQFKVKKSKWQILNLWRRITNTEKMEEIIESTHINPYTGEFSEKRDFLPFWAANKLT